MVESVFSFFFLGRFLGRKRFFLSFVIICILKIKEFLLLRNFVRVQRILFPNHWWPWLVFFVIIFKFFRDCVRVQRTSADSGTLPRL